MKYLTICALYCLAITLNGQDLIHGTTVSHEYNTNLSPYPLAQNVQSISNKKSRGIDLFTKPQVQKKVNSKYDFVDHLVLDLSEKAIDLLRKNYKKKTLTKIAIPTKDKSSINLLLAPFEVFSERFLAKNGEDKYIEVKKENYAFYQGIVEGDQRSFVSLSITPSGMNLVMSDANGNYNITSLEESKSEYIFFNDYNLEDQRSLSCGDIDQFESKRKKGIENIDQEGNEDFEEESRTQKSARSRVEVDLEIDYDLFALHGSNENQTIDWSIDLMTAAISWYQMEFVSLALSEITVWDTNADPFNNIGQDSEELGDQLEAWAASNNPHGDIAHYLGSEVGSTMMIGRANGIGGFCDPIDGGIFDVASSHCVSLGMLPQFNMIDANASMIAGFNVPSWELYIFCHEMGHVFGSKHTHACNWGASGLSAIDNCETTEGLCSPGPAPINGGTMMSYCSPINLSKGFHPEPGHEIRSTINSSSCLVHSEESCPRLTTLVNNIDDSATYDASEIIFVYDGSVDVGSSPVLSAGEKTMFLGGFTVPAGAGLRINEEGCN